MTKEEVLEQLKQISSLMANDGAMTTNENENNIEFNSLEDQKAVLEKQISELELKLSDNANYPSFEYLANKSKLASIRKKMENLSSSEKRNEAAIANSTNEIAKIDTEIARCNMYISGYTKQIDEIGRQIRSLGENPDKKQEEKLSKELQYKRESLNDLRSELDSHNKARENLSAAIASMNAVNEKIDDTLARYEALERTISEKDAQDSRTPIDESKKFKDEQQLHRLRSNLDAIQNRMNFVETSSQEELNMLITEIEAGSIDEKDIVARVQQIKSKLPEPLINTNYDKYESEIEENRIQQAEVTSEISELQTKLSDPVNYTPSMFAVEVMNDEITNLEAIVAEHDNRLSVLEELIVEHEKGISNNEEAIANAEARIEEIQEKNDDIKFRMTDESLSKTEYNDLVKQFNNNKKEIKNCRDQIDRYEKNISTLETLISNTKKNRKETENIKISDAKLLASRKDSLEDRKTIDRLAMLQDRDRLALLTAQLTALKGQEEVLNGIYYTKLDEILNNVNLDNTKDGGPVPPVGGSNGQGEGEPTKDDNPVPVPPVGGSNEPSEDDPTKDDNPVPVPPVGGSNGQGEGEPTKDDNPVPVPPAPKPEKLDDPIFFDESRYQKGYEYLTPENAMNLGKLADPDAEPEKDNTPVAIVAFRKAKDSLINKLKDPKFVKKLKIAAGVALLALATLIASCATKKTNTPVEPTEIVTNIDIPEIDLDHLDDILNGNNNGNEEVEEEASKEEETDREITIDDITPGPGKVTPEPGEATPEPGEQNPDPGYVTPEPGDQTPDPNVGEPPLPGDDDEQPEIPDPGDQTPDPGVVDPDPAVNPIPDEDTQDPGDEDPDLGDEDPDLDDEDPDLGDEDPDLGDEDPDLGDEDPDLGDEDPDLGDEEEDNEFDDEVNLKPGESLVVPEEDGSYTIVDNSDGENSGVIDDEFEDTNYDYPESEEIGDVTWNEDGTVDVETNVPDAQPTDDPYYGSDLSPEEKAFLDAILQEQQAHLEQTGRHR